MSDEKAKSAQPKKATKQNGNQETKKQKPQVTVLNVNSSKKNHEKALKKMQHTVREKSNLIVSLERKVSALENEMLMHINQFKTKANQFASDAKVQIEHFKTKHQAKTSENVKTIRKYATQDLVSEIIEPLANLKVAIKAGKSSENQAVSHYVIGFEMLLKQIDAILESHGIKIIATVIGDEFNPTYHQVIATQEGAEGHVIAIKKPGYMLHDRVIKPTLIVIGKKNKREKE